jgi:hypothetical protein
MPVLRKSFLLSFKGRGKVKMRVFVPVMLRDFGKDIQSLSPWHSASLLDGMWGVSDGL